jgi:hypothetical protein
MQYWDTSALLKLYVPELDSQQFAARVAPPGVHDPHMRAGATAIGLKIFP